jgi:hypothetical protein
MSSVERVEQPVNWRKARRSIGNGECVEIAPVAGMVLVRDSKRPDASILRYPADAWQLFLSGARRGDFDVLRLLSRPPEQGGRPSVLNGLQLSMP